MHAMLCILLCLSCMYFQVLVLKIFYINVGYLQCRERLVVVVGKLQGKELHPGFFAGSSK